jgi:hypothetical protein
VYFLGFPYGLKEDVTADINNDFPLPFVKRGIIASFQFFGSPDLATFYIDGHNNPGFSGGPVVALKPTRQAVVIGVVSGYSARSEPVLQRDGKPTSLFWEYNTGLVLAYPIQHALRLIGAYTSRPAST